MRAQSQLLMSVTLLAACSTFLLLTGASVPSPAGAPPAAPVGMTPAVTELSLPEVLPAPPIVATPVTPTRPNLQAVAPPQPPPPAADGTEPAAGPVKAPASSGDASEWVDALGTSRDPIDTGGRTIRWSLEVEAATGLDVASVLSVAEDALYDGRSWARDFDLRRVAPGDARIRVLIATPDTVDRLCAGAGLNTAGRLSCWTGSVAAINLDRWLSGTSEIKDLDLYRRYVVNHEVGHGLGHGHVDCAGSGQLAHVMQQQTKSLDGCVANPWAHPNS